MSEETIHGYNYKVRIWHPNAPEDSTEGTILAAYEEDLAKQIQLQYPGVSYEIISKEPVVGNPGHHGERAQQAWREVAATAQKCEVCATALSYSEVSESWYCPKCAFGQAARGSNPGPDSELLFKTPIKWADQFIAALRRQSFDVGHDADYEDPENYMTVIVRDVPLDRMRSLLDTAKQYAADQKHYEPADNLRDRLIAEVYDNRMNAWKQGHWRIRPVSDADLTELRSMSTQELEQTAKLTRQFLIPMVEQPQEDPLRLRKLMGTADMEIRYYSEDKVSISFVTPSAAYTFYTTTPPGSTIEESIEHLKKYFTSIKYEQ